MNKYSKALLAGVALLSATSVAAQNRSAYFLDNYVYNFQLNPAMSIDRKLDVSFPGLGNLNVGFAGNIGLKNFLFYDNATGKTTTFMNPSVSDTQFLNGLKNHNRVGFDLREGIMSVGFKALGGYNHVSINAVANAQVRAPKSLFAFLKQGIENKTYDIGRIDAHADAYVEIALNHSHSLENVLPGLKVGASVKALIGLANFDVNMNKADVTLGVDNWTAVTNGIMYMNAKGASFQTRYNKQAQRQYVDGFDFDDFSPVGGGGIAFDLGATYRLNQDWDFALAFNDIGFITWSSNQMATTNGDRTFSLNDYTLDPGNFDDSWKPIKDNMTALYQFTPETNAGSRTRALEATMNVSARYTLPAYRRLSFGLLNTTRMAHRFAWTEFRLSANITPIDWLSAAINYNVGTFGSAFGWVLNIAPKGFNFYIGMDRTLGKTASQMIPLNFNGQLSMGINFPI